MAALTAPPDPELAGRLRRAVLQVRESCPRGRFEPALHVGTHRVAADDPADHARATDVVAALLRRTPEADPLCWLARPGALSPHDLDLAWLAAAGSAHDEAGRTLTFVVVTRDGWRDPRTGLRREWRRLRDRSGRSVTRS